MPPSRRHRQAQEIEAILRERIRVPTDGDFRLPSETELSEEFGVSRVTVREALASLERKGLILRRQGLGTFVNTKAVNIQTRLDESVEFAELIRSSGYEPELSYLHCAVEPATPDISERLQIEAGSSVVAIKKVFLANHIPVIYCINMIPLSLIDDEQERATTCSEIDPSLSIYTVLARWFSQQVSFQISDVEACNANEVSASMLKCPRGTALLHLQDIGFNERQKAVFLGDLYYMPGLIQFQLIRKPLYNIEPFMK
jgi:GntR family transcriptional regulator